MLTYDILNHYGSGDHDCTDTNMAHLIVLGCWRKADLITQGPVFWELLRKCKHEGIRGISNKYQIFHLHLGISSTPGMLAIKGTEFRNILVKEDGYMLECADCETGNSCTKTIALSFDSKGMEITSRLRLTNLTHIHIEPCHCIMDIYDATHFTKADMTVYVYPQSRVALVPHSDIQLTGRETNTSVTMNVKTDHMEVYTCTASNLVVAIITNTINTCFRPG